MNIKTLIISALLPAAAICSTSASAANFFDTSAPESLFSLGVRFGVNTSNKNLNKPVFDTWNCNSWGTGIDAGVVADLHFKDFISLQPGFFYESRSGKYTYINTDSFNTEGPVYLSQFGRIRSYNFTIPVMCALHFNLSEDVRWNVEAGPYVQVILKNSETGEFLYPQYAADATLPQSYSPLKPTNFDFGIKVGTSLRILNHYLVGVHYEAGCLKPWKDSRLGGRNKAWVFSIGYDL